MIIAHLSDLHLIALAQLAPRRLLNKRFTGWVNIKLRRGSVHKLFAAEAVMRAVGASGADHVVITGDVSNLALEDEFELMRGLLRDALRLPADRVSMVPGNHDAYTRGAHASQRFESYFGEYLTSDLPGASNVPGAGRYPYVRLRGPVALIGLSTALPRLPMVASGELGAVQCLALRSLLAHDAVRARLPVLLQHHPWHAPSGFAATVLRGLRDAEDERLALEHLERGLLLHGHLHRRVHRTIATRTGQLDAIGASSASLVVDDERAVAGFNLYDIDDSGALTSVHAHRLDPTTRRIERTTVARA